MHVLADIYVLDDGSTDGTEAAIASSGLSNYVIYERSESNQGYSRAFVRAFARVTTPFLMMSTDDDFLVASGIAEFVDHLHSAKHSALMSTVFLLSDGTRYRGRTVTSAIAGSDIRQALNHAPGLAYATNHALTYLPIVEQRLAQGCSMAATYPQVLLGVLIAMNHRADWIPISTVRSGPNLASGIRDSSGLSYSSGKSRISQIIDFDNFLQSTFQNAATRSAARFLWQVLGMHRNAALNNVLRAVSHEAPGLSVSLVTSASLLPIKRPRFTLRAWMSRLRGRR